MTKTYQVQPKACGPSPLCPGKAMCPGDPLMPWAKLTQAVSEAEPGGNGLWSSDILGQV